MITLSSVRGQGLKAWSARAWINGRPVVLAEGLPTRTLSALRGRSTAQVSLRDLPPAAGGQPAAVDLLLDGVGAIRFFTGRTDQRSASSARMQRQANLVDLLDLDRAFPADRTWSSRSFPDAVRDLLTDAGIAASDIDSVFDPGATYALGPVYPIQLTTKESVGQVWRELLDFGGAAVYVTPSGRVRVVEAPSLPAATSQIIYARGHQALEFGIFDAGYSIEGNEAIVSVFTATGPKRPDGAIPDGTFTATGIVGKPEAQQYRFAQSDATCQAIARRELGRRSRALVNVWVEAPLNPFILPGDTILVRDAAIGLPTNTPAIVTEAATTANASMRLQLSIGASLVDGYSTSTPPPYADFAMLVEHQLVTLAGVPVASYLVQCQDLSRDPTGQEITRSWTASGPGASPTSSTVPQPIFLFTDIAAAEISLTATSASGEAATVTKQPQASDLQTLTRIVSVACGSAGWRVLATTAGWRSYAGPGGASCTAVPAFNEIGPLLSGWSNGAIYRSLDALSTTPTLLATLSGSIGALFVNEADSLQLLAGHGSKVSRSQDGGTTWSQIGSFAGDVTDCQSSPANPNEIRVTAGGAEQISYTGGASWAAIVTGAAGATARAIASAPWGHAVAFSGTIAAADAVKFEESGLSVEWSGVPGPDLPTNGLTSITPLLDEEGYVAGETPDLIRDGVLSALVLSAGAGKLYRLGPVIGGFSATLIATAAGSGAGKIINEAAHYPIDDVAAASIGYGGLGAPVLVVQSTLIRLPSGASGTADKIWFYTNGTWTGKNPPEPERTDWQRIVANPFNPQELLLLRATSGAPKGGADTNRLWYSADFGISWQSVYQDMLINDVFRTQDIEWSPSASGDWATWQHWRESWSLVRTNRLIRGSRTTYAVAYENNDNDSGFNRFSVGWGIDGEIISVDRSVFRWFNAASVPQSGPGGASTSADITIDLLAPTRAALACRPATSVIYCTSDYRTSGWAALSATGASAAALANGTVVIGGRANGVQEVVDAWGAASVSVAAFAGKETGHIRTDRQTQTLAAVALVDGVTGVRLADGTWATVNKPDTATGLAGWVEIIGSEG